MHQRSEKDQAELTSDGHSPSSARPSDPADEGRQHPEVAPSAGLYDLPRASFLIKLAIVLFVFPTFAWLIQILFVLVLAFPAAALPAAWQDDVYLTVQVATTLIGLIGAFLISRRCWPKPAQW